MFETVSWLDMGAGALVLALAVAGALRGFVRTLFSLIAASVGLMLATQYGHTLGAEDWPVISGLPNPEGLGVALGCAIVFVGVLLVGVLLGRLVRKILEGAELGALDRVLGLVLGGAKGVLIAAVVTLGLLALDQPTFEDAAQDSYTLEGTRKVFEVVEEYLPEPIVAWTADQLGDQRLNASGTPPK